MNFVPSIMNPIYVLIFYALEACGSWLSPLTPEPNKENRLFSHPRLILRGAETNSPYSACNWQSIKTCVLYNFGGFTAELGAATLGAEV